jgi:outer membrane protein OmpA-like peptidoglycan-associated protein
MTNVLLKQVLLNFKDVHVLQFPNGSRTRAIKCLCRTILFEAGKATIKDSICTDSSDIIAILNKYPDARFSIDGHTDSVGF